LGPPQDPRHSIPGADNGVRIHGQTPPAVQSHEPAGGWRRLHRVKPRHVLDAIENIREQGAGFRSLTEGLDTTGPMGTAMLMIMAAFAQLERDTMIERTRAGLAAAAANNRHGGRPRKIEDAATARAKELKGKESAPPTSARCSESPAPRSTDTLYGQPGQRVHAFKVKYLRFGRGLHAGRSGHIGAIVYVPPGGSVLP
jgi:Resolvase, N terminal domain